MDVEAFIGRWTAREGGAERANYQMFLSELCDVIGVERPDPAGAERDQNDYVFERAVRPRGSEGSTAPKRIDLYKRDTFILEAKQSRLPGKKNAIEGQLAIDEPESLGRRAPARWDVMMQNARKQAENYVFLLDADHPAPPFVIVCDVANCLELYADFTGTGRAYEQFPDRKTYRIFLEDLRDEDVRKRLATVWSEPHSLDPTKTAARVTREIAKRLADVSRALEERGCNAEDVAHFLMRCLFTMFAEDVDLLPRGSFRTLLERSVDDPAHFPLRLKRLWTEMERGEPYSSVIDAKVRHFNGGLFKDTTVFELGREEIGELLAAARADWTLVDPAIFGTLLEQALDKTERKKLGAHYTPRAYVQRLVDVTVMEPLREDWQAALTKAEAAKDGGDDKRAIVLVRAFHHKLCTTRVLDPACGTGNFLYVALELMKKLEGEVLQTLNALGDTQGALVLAGDESVDPHQFLGLDLTLTGLYNVLEKIRAGASLDAKDEDVKQRGLVLILKELHDQIDAATAQAYGWPADLPDEEILARLVALNAERAKEEAAGHVRWLRPDYQIPRFAKDVQAQSDKLNLGETVVAIDKGLPAFPADRDEQPLAVEAALVAAGRPISPADLARGYKQGGRRIEQRIVQSLATLARYGRATALKDGRYASRLAA